MSVKKGKWYVDRYPTHGRVLVYIEEVKKNYVIGYGIDNRYEWSGPGNKWYAKNLDHLVEASKDEVLERLKAFAISKGYVEGVTLISSLSWHSVSNIKIPKKVSWEIDQGKHLLIHISSAVCKYLMRDGKWLPFSVGDIEDKVSHEELIFKCI